MAQYNTYQNAPQVRQLDEALPQQHAYFGDASLEPNTGLTNSYDYALFGLALHELLDRLRYSVICSSVWLFLIIFFTWWARIIRPVGLLLSFLLAILDFILLVVEVSSLFRGAPQGSTERPKLLEFIDQTEQVGLVILFHPIGKTCYLIVCGSLCWWVGGMWEILVGLSFFVEAAILLYCWVTYPEFRRTFDTDLDDSNTPKSTSTSPMRWSHFYDGGDSVSSLGGEGSSLLKQAGHAFGM